MISDYLHVLITFILEECEWIVAWHEKLHLPFSLGGPNTPEDNLLWSWRRWRATAANISLETP